MKFAFLFCSLFCLIACSTSKVTTDKVDQDYPNSEIVEALLIRKKMFNKAGRELPGDGDFFLVIKGEDTFVKLMESKVTVDQLEPLLDMKSKYRILKNEGLWDTDDPNVQSRIGPYVAILEIL